MFQCQLSLPKFSITWSFLCACCTVHFYRGWWKVIKKLINSNTDIDEHTMDFTNKRCQNLLLLSCPVFSTFSKVTWERGFKISIFLGAVIINGEYPPEVFSRDLKLAILSWNCQNISCSWKLQIIIIIILNEMLK